MEIPDHWPNTWKHYISTLSAIARERLVMILQLIEANFPEATLDWAYQMPTFKYNNKPLVYAAGYAKHTGMYALPNTHAAFVERLKPYKQGKGSVQFPHAKPLPVALIQEMISFRKQSIDA